MAKSKPFAKASKSDRKTIESVLKRAGISTERVKKPFRHIITFATQEMQFQATLDTADEVLLSSEFDQVVAKEFPRSKNWIVTNHMVLQNK